MCHRKQDAFQEEESGHVCGMLLAHHGTNHFNSMEVVGDLRSNFRGEVEIKA